MAKLKQILIIPIGLVLALVPFSLLIGWNLFTLFLYWFIAVPLLSFHLPTLVKRNTHRLFSSIAGLTIFYGFMVFMIYEHYQSDFFQVLIWSGVINLVILIVMEVVKVKRGWMPREYKPAAL